MLFVSVIKFIHLLFVVSLTGATFYHVALVGWKRQDPIPAINLSLFLLSLGALTTGTLLVLPKHFTFHTPWIEAAYLLVLAYCLGLAGLILFRNNALVKKYRVMGLLYFTLIIVLVLVIHDAVTKTTFML